MKIPCFSNSIEAILFGLAFAGDRNMVYRLYAKKIRVKLLCDKALNMRNANRLSRLAVAHQFLRECIEASLGKLEKQYLKYLPEVSI